MKENKDLETNDLLELSEEEINYHENTYEIIYVDDINKEKYLQKKKKEEEKEKEIEVTKKNKKINKILNILITIVSIGILISVVLLAFPEKIEQIKAPIEAYFINKEIEKEAELGNLKPAGEYEEETIEENIDINWNEETYSENNIIIDNNEKKASSFAINDEKIYNFNENITIKVPDKAYVQSTNEEKVLMLNSQKVFDLILNCKAYEVSEQNGKYYLIIHSEITNKNNAEEISLEGIISTKVNNEIIVSNKSNIKIQQGETKKVDIFSSLTEEQYKLIRNELNNIDFVYKDTYNYREIFATYGANYLK